MAGSSLQLVGAIPTGRFRRLFQMDAFDIIDDGRLISSQRPALWSTHSEGQVYLTSLFNHPVGYGPAVTASVEISGRHHLRGSYGGKGVLQLYRDRERNHPSITPSLR